MIGKLNFTKCMRITWILLSTSNYRSHQHQLTGQLSTEVIQAAVKIWIAQIQKKMLHYPQHKQYEEHLNLVKDEQGIVVCKGRTQGFNPIFLYRNATFTEEMVMDAHLRTLHGENGSTMAEVRQKIGYLNWNN